MISVVPYDTAWPGLFAEEEKRLHNAIGSYIVKIEHMGSTAVPQLAAKPVIDILIGVDSLDRVNAQVILSLYKLGYNYIQALEKEIPLRRYFQKLTAQGEHTHHIHIVEINGELWRRYVFFRDYLRSHRKDAQQYQALKLKLAQQHRDRKKYTDAKTAFVKQIETKAKR